MVQSFYQKKSTLLRRKKEGKNKMNQCWDYHHIEPVRPHMLSSHANVAKVVSLTIFLLGLGILVAAAVGWWRQTSCIRGYTYQGSDTRLSGYWVPTRQRYHGHPVFCRTTGDMYLYHGSVQPDRSLWIFSTSLAEADDASHVAYASGPRGSLSNLVVTGNGHIGKLVPQ